jgi:hypothetical protein
MYWRWLKSIRGRDIDDKATSAHERSSTRLTVITCPTSATTEEEHLLSRSARSAARTDNYRDPSSIPKSSPADTALHKHLLNRPSLLSLQLLRMTSVFRRLW